MRKMSVLLWIAVVVLGGTFLWPVGAQDGTGEIIYSRYRQFRIPFQAGPGESRLKQLQLFVSSDQGRTWQASALAPPEQRHFRFVCERDGYFWFAVQTQDQENKLYPPSMDGATPSLKVIVDTQPPAVFLQPLAPRGNEVGVSWEVRDDNPDQALSDALRLEYRASGSAHWLPLPRTPTGNQAYWTPESNGAFEVRLRARDRAGNWGEATTTVSLNGPGGNAAPFQTNPGFNEPVAEANPSNLPLDPDRRIVNSKRINLNFELKEVGPSGVSTVELWYTLDGRSWNKHPLRAEDANPKNLAFEVNGEGVYGMTLVAKSGVGLGERPPQLGDRPQVWIEVDLTKPVVQLYQVQVGQGMDKGKLSINWAARDKNLHRQPITLSYAENPTGPWAPIIQNQANTGRYIWTMPERVPYQFHVKVEATDLAGNIGEAITPDLIKVDLSLPKVKILTVEPTGR